MIQILQVRCTPDSVDALTENYHMNCVEYLPFAKEEKYHVDDIFLTIRLDKETEESKELIETNGFMRALSSANHILSGHDDYDVTSISYPFDMEENENRTFLIITATVSKSSLFLDEELQKMGNDFVNDLFNYKDKVIQKLDAKEKEEPVVKPEEKVPENPSDIKQVASNNNSEPLISENVIDDDEEITAQTVIRVEEAAVVNDNDNNNKNKESNDIFEDDIPLESTNIEEQEESQSNLSLDDIYSRLSGDQFSSDISSYNKEASLYNLLQESMSELQQTKEEKDNSKEEKQSELTIAEKNRTPLPKKIKYETHEIPASQKKAYDAATDSIPFLNMIDDYIPSFDIEALSNDTPLYEIHEDDYYQDLISSRKKFYENFTRIIKEMTGIEHLALEKTLRDPNLEDEMMEDIDRFIKANIQVPDHDKPILMAKVKNALLSYYVLTNAINNPDVTDIRVLSYDNINVKIHGDHFKASGLHFIDEEDYTLFINRIIIRHKLTVQYPILVFTDKDFHPDYILRFNLCLGMLNSTGTPYLHIRKVPKDKTTLTKLIEDKMLDEKIAHYLLDKVRTSRGMVFAGPSASGKTTLMNALIDYIPKEKSILCIQESAELFSNIHPNAYFQSIVKDQYGQILIGLSELGQNGLLCDSGYMIIGESKGAEVRDLLRASNTGHKCWTSVHSQSSQETIPRLADYVKYGADYSFDEATRMLKDLEVIIYIQEYKIMEISEIVGYDDDKKQLIYKSIYKRDYQKPAAKNKKSQKPAEKPIEKPIDEQ
jgi:pilus assembly protein CpaF